MTTLRRPGGGCISISWSLCLALFLGFFLIQSETSLAQAPSYQVELRVTAKPELQLLDSQGKIRQSLPVGSVRKRINLGSIPLRVSFGEDRGHHLVIMVGPDYTGNHPVSFLLGKNILISSPEANMTLQISPDLQSAKVTPGLMGKIWVNNSLLPRGESKKIALTHSPRSLPSPDQPQPTVRDFQTIPTPSL